MTVSLYEIGSMGGPYYEKRQQNGTNTPLALRLLGRWSNNPYSMIRTSQINPTIEPVFYDSSGRGYTVPPNLRSARDWFSVGASSGTAPARTELIAKLADSWRDSDVNVGMYLSPEGRESAQMVGSSLERIYRSARSLRKGNFGGFLSELRPVPRPDRRRSYRKFTQGDLSGSFLAAHLGWTPLIQDAFNASDIFKDSEYRSNNIQSKKGYSGSYVKPVRLPKGAEILNATAFGVSSLIAKYKREPTTPERLGMQNPFLVAWELVPLSFVADYFLPIGPTIDSLAFVGSRVTSSVIRKEYTEISYEVRIPAGSLAITNSGRIYRSRQAYHYRLSDRKFSRINEPLSFSECLNWNLKLPTSVMKLATLASLTHQSILDLKKR